MHLRATALSDVGQRRAANEDRYVLAADLGLYLVADGMGGHKAGQVAAELAAQAAVDALRTLVDASASLAEKLRYAVAAANIPNRVSQAFIGDWQAPRSRKPTTWPYMV